VAVLYADYGLGGVSLNPEALETLVRVAGLTVELAAAAVQPSAVPQYPPAEAMAAAVRESAYPKRARTVEEPQADETPAAEIDSAAEEYQGVQEFEHADVKAWESQQASAGTTPERVEKGFEAVSEPGPSGQAEAFSYETVGRPTIWEEPEAPAVALEEPVPVERFGEQVVEEAEVIYAPVEEQHVSEPAFARTEPVEEYIPVEAVEEFPEVLDEPAADPVAEYSRNVEHPAANGSPAPAIFEQAAEIASGQAAPTRYRDRSVDLPIEVPEEERRQHNDARRFARLLVSEIKLYNEQKVAEGRQSGDLYDRLREAIDRSREMYDKRVQQPVADKFDYFHYELVTSLAEGEDVKLGASYPGSRVPA
jgi:hypothetical protein